MSYEFAVSGADFLGVGPAGAVGEVVGIDDVGHFVADAFATGIFVPAALGAGGDLLGVGVGGLGGGLWRAVSRGWRRAGASTGRRGGADSDEGDGEEGECFHGDGCLVWCISRGVFAVFTEAHRQVRKFDCWEVKKLFFPRRVWQFLFRSYCEICCECRVSPANSMAEGHPCVDQGELIE